MQLRRGNMWSVYKEADIFLITANSTITNGELVMGGGIAGEAKARWPRLPKILGTQLARWPGHLGEYNVYISLDWSYFDTTAKLALFQTKTNWRSNSDLALITRSVEHLAIQAHRWAEKKFHLNYPGIGLGNLSRKQVEPIIKILPDNVTVWYL